MHIDAADARGASWRRRGAPEGRHLRPRGSADERARGGASAPAAAQRAARPARRPRAQAQVIQPLNGDPFVSFLETPVTSSPLVVSYLSNLPAYRTGVSPLLRGVEIGLTHGFFLPGPFIKARRGRASARAARRGGAGRATAAAAACRAPLCCRCCRRRCAALGLAAARGDAPRRRAALNRGSPPHRTTPPSPAPTMPARSSARSATWRAPPRSRAAWPPPAWWASWRSA
jgi:hypothetical protein